MKVKNIIAKKLNRKKITVLTAYDAAMGQILDKCGIDIILIGDSLGMVFQGKKTTKEVVIEDICYHVSAVSTGVKNALIVGDMPVDTYRTEKEALLNAEKIIKAGADAVKIEGNNPVITSKLISEGIDVMGHLGLLPQTAEKFKVQGKTVEDARKVLNDARQLAEAGVFSIVLECIPEALGEMITKEIPVPTIGIGAGVRCDGQVLVINDLLGYSDKPMPKFVKKYANLNKIISEAVDSYIADVKSKDFPSKEYIYH